MEKLILIDAQYVDEIRVGVVENDGELSYFETEYKYHKPIKGNIYFAKVERIEQSIQAAFINYGEEKHGFLPLSEIHPDYYSKNCNIKNAKIQKVIRPGQMVIAQAIKEQRGNKCPTFSTYLNLPGRFCILLASNKQAGISSRIEHKEQFDDMLKTLELPEGFGVIIRTASDGVNLRDIKKDFSYLTHVLLEIKTIAASASNPVMLYEERNIVKRTIRDLFQKDIEKIIVQGEEAYREAQNFIKIYSPRSKKNVILYDAITPIFEHYNVEKQIEQIANPVVQLKSGGNIVICATEALTAIDVNSAKMRKTNNIDDTAFATNIEAANEIAKQIKLRDIAGLIVIDFIDMIDKQNIKKIEKCFKDAMSNDRAVTNILKISALGMLELSRQRMQQSYLDYNLNICPCCYGIGKVLSDENISMSIIRKLEHFIRVENAQTITVYTSEKIAMHCLNYKRALIKSIEAQTGACIVFEIKPYFEMHEYEFTINSYLTRSLENEKNIENKEMVKKKHNKVKKQKTPSYEVNNMRSNG